jgi:hypothetical protein
VIIDQLQEVVLLEFDNPGLETKTEMRGILSCTTRKHVTFAHPFLLPTLGEEQPAGSYLVETDEELAQSLSFPAYKRVRTIIYLHAAGDAYVTGSASIDPGELESALERDGRTANTEGHPCR